MFNLRLRKNRAQTTLEYAILIGVIVGGLIAMQVYLKRGFQGKLRESADSMGDQFSPGYTTYNYTTNTFTNSEESFNKELQSTQIHNQETNRFGNENVSNFSDEYWWTHDGE